MNFLKKIRKSKGLRQQDLGKELHISQTEVSNMEKDHYQFSEVEINNICNILSCTRDQLLGKESINYLPDRMSKIGLNCAKIRIDKELSIKYISDKTKIRRQYIWALENGKYNMEEDDLKKIAEALGVTYDYLVYGFEEIIEKKQNKPYLFVDKEIKFNASYLDESIKIVQKLMPDANLEQAIDALYKIYKKVYNFYENKKKISNTQNNLDIDLEMLRTMPESQYRAQRM